MERKTVFLIIPEMEIGGAQRSMAKLSLELEKVYKVYLIVFNYTYEIPYEFGGQVLDLEVTGGNNILSKGTQFLKRINKLKALKKKHKPYASISFLEGADFINSLSSQGEKIVFSIRGSKIHDETINGFIGKLRLKVLLPYFLKRADKIVSVNQGIKEEISSISAVKKNNIKVIPNFYDINQIQQLAAEPLSADFASYFREHQTMVMSGRLAIEKGQRYLILLLKEIKASLKNVKLVLIGDGPEYPKLTQLCDENNLSWSKTPTTSVDVLFIPHQSNIFKFISRATLYVMCSSSEGFPNGLCEAMICGTPVISSDCPYGPSEILSPKGKEGAGILLPVLQGKVAQNFEKCMQVWKDNVLKLLSQQSLLESLKLNATKRVNEFTTESALKAWVETIEEL